jgi:tRNA threonylcarbamoyladenosine biosynthesis protein TsaE
VTSGARKRIVTRGAAETRALGQALAAVARPGDVVSLIGDLGAGKTVLAKGFGAGLGIADTITSPTFVLMAEYRGRLPLFHVDLYRLAGVSEALAGGLVDERQIEGVTLIEWAERLADALPDERLEVFIEGGGDEPRTITLVAGAGFERYLEAADHSLAGNAAGNVAGNVAAAEASR